MRVTNDSDSPLNNPIPPDYESLRNACKRDGILDPDLVLDVYAVCSVKSRSVDFKEIDVILEAFDRSDPDYWKSRATLTERMRYLEALSNTVYMKALIDLGDPMKAALTFIDSLSRVAKAQQAKNATSKPIYDLDIDTNADMDIDGKTIEQIEDLEAAMAKDYDSVDSVNEMLNRITTPEQIIEDEAAAAFLEGGGGQSEDQGTTVTSAATAAAFGSIRTPFDQTYSPSLNVAQAVVREGHSIPQNFPKFFDIFQAACTDVGSGKLKEQDGESPKVKGSKKMEEINELVTVDPTEMAKETFDVRAANKELEVARTVEDIEGKSHLFVLLDVSASMSGRGAGGVSRAFAANAITLALLKYALDGKYKVWVVPFASNVDHRNVKEAGDRASALAAMKWLGSLNYDGGGTSIEAAIMYAYKQLQTDPKYRKCEIVLVTDGASTMSSKIHTDQPTNTTLRTIFLTNVKNECDSNSMNNLSKASKSAVTLAWNGPAARFDFGDVFQGLEKWAN